MSQKMTIVLVEDDKELRGLLALSLIANGNNVLQAENGVQAFNILKEHHVDLVITDIRMPGGDGVQLLRNLKYFKRSMSVIVITGFAEIAYAELYKLGVQLILEKPFTLEKFLSSVESEMALRKSTG